MSTYGKITIMKEGYIIVRPESLGGEYERKMEKAIDSLCEKTGVGVDQYYQSGVHSNSAIGDFIDGVLDIVSEEFSQDKDLSELFRYAERRSYGKVIKKWKVK